jgi:hypothetical protein
VLYPQHRSTSNRLTVAIDGTYVRSDLTNGLYQHYVIAGRVERDGQLGGHFAWVAQRPEDALEFMRAAMRSDGWTERSQVAVLADGADRPITDRTTFTAVCDGTDGPCAVDCYRTFIPAAMRSPRSLSTLCQYSRVRASTGSETPSLR